MSTKQQDVLHRFLFEDLGIRGLWVRLEDSWQTAKHYQKAPEEAQLQLAQALTAALLLSSTIKFEGSLILQIHGDGPLRTLVAQATHDRKIRGLVKCEGDINPASRQSLFGEGRVVITISPENGNPYQGVVPLQGNNIASALETYFRQSEQLNTRLWLFADSQRATGMLLQELPSASKNQADWAHIEILANTLTEQETQDLECETLLYRLFNQEKIKLFDAEKIAFECSCSRAKIENALRMMGREELENILAERGRIDVNCEFCNKDYAFDTIDIEQLLRPGSAASGNPERRH